MMHTAVTGALGGKTMQAAGEGLGAGLGEAPTAPHPFAPAQIQDGGGGTETPTDFIAEAERNPDTAGESVED